MKNSLFKSVEITSAQSALTACFGKQVMARRFCPLWSAVPAFALLAFVLFFSGMTEGHFARTEYWGAQREWFIALNLELSFWPALLWSNLTLVGDAAVLFPLFSFLLLWRPHAWVAMFAALPLGALLAVTGKNFAAVPRPAAVLDHQHFSLIGDALTGNSSLPSGHSITIFGAAIAILATLVPVPRTRSHWLILTSGVMLASVLCLSRVAIGAHWPLDLLAGAACGWVAGLSGALLVRYKLDGWHWQSTQKLALILGLVLMSWSLLLVNRAFSEAEAGQVTLWLAACCGIITSLKILRAQVVVSKVAV